MYLKYFMLYYLKIWCAFTIICFQILSADLLLPENNAYLQYIHIAFEWEQEADAVEYNLQVAIDDDSDFINPVIDILDPSLVAIITEDLDWETSYLWRVRPIYLDGDGGDWIDTYSFTIHNYMDISISISNSYPDIFFPGYNLFGTLGPPAKSSWITDMSGNIIWGSDMLPFNPISTLIENGNMLGMYFNESDSLSSYDSKTAVEYSLDNEIIWSTQDTLPVHHDMIVLPNGNYLVLMQEIQNGPIPLGSWTPFFETAGYEADGISIEFPWVGDQIIELDKESKEILWSWSTFDYFSMEDYDTLGNEWQFAMSVLSYDWTHCNSLWFDEEENTILLSSRHLSRVTKINYSTGEIIWNMGVEMPSGQVDFGTDLCFSYQHSITQLENGNLLLLDNGNLSPYYCNTEHPVTRALEISIIEEEGDYNAELIWEYILPDNFAGRFMGSCERLPNGNTLITPGGLIPNIGKAFEVTSDNEIVWELEASTTVNQIFRISGLHPQKFSIIQPNFVWYLPTPTMYLSLGDNTISYTIYNEGDKAQIYQYDFQDNGIWFEDMNGTIEIESGNSMELQFSGTVFNEIYPHTLSLIVTPLEAPELSKTVEIDVWSTTLSLNNTQIPLEFSVNPAYPNPFNSETIINYHVPNPSEVKITVFDLTGRRVENIESKWINSGYHRFRWSPENLATGVYVIQYNVKESAKNIEKVLTQKLIYLK